MKKRALIIGAAGQDGTLLAELLKSRQVEYVGLTREGTVDSDGRLLQSGKLADFEFIKEMVKSISPSHVYYLAAHHHSSQEANHSPNSKLWELSLEAQVLGLAHVLDALCLYSPGARLFYAASSHVFGLTTETPQNEDTLMIPANVYGVTKIMGIEACRYYQREQALYTSVGILYNHESAHRKQSFLSQKIIRGALDIKSGRAKGLALGDLSAEADWGYAPDYVDAMVRILNQPEPGKYIIATGEKHSVREFVELAFQNLDLDYREWVTEDPSIIRKTKSLLVGDASKLRRETGWSPSVTFPEMIRLLTEQTQRRHSR